MVRGTEGSLRGSCGEVVTEEEANIIMCYINIDVHVYNCIDWDIVWFVT